MEGNPTVSHHGDTSRRQLQHQPELQEHPTRQDPLRRRCDEKKNRITDLEEGPIGHTKKKGVCFFSPKVVVVFNVLFYVLFLLDDLIVCFNNC